MFTFLRNLFRPPPTPPRPRGVRPQVEGLEDRAVLSTLSARPGVHVARPHHPNRLEARHFHVRHPLRFNNARFNNARFFNQSPFFGGPFFGRRSGFGLGLGSGFLGFSSFDPFGNTFIDPSFFTDAVPVAPVDPFFDPSFFGGFF